MPRSIMFALAFWLPASAATAADCTFVDDPVAMDREVSPKVLNSAHKLLVDALKARAQTPLLVGQAALAQVLTDAAAGSRPASASWLRAQALLASGKSAYLAFEFELAAASLAEAAAMLSSEMATLLPEQVGQLFEARVLEGVSWLEAGKQGAAKSAFRKLLVLRPDFEPDPVTVPPAALEFFQRTKNSLRQAGQARLLIRTVPEGANVIIDGRLVGASPIALSGVALGIHAVRVTHPGYEISTRSIAMNSAKEYTESVSLKLLPTMQARARLRQAAVQGQKAASAERELEELREGSGCSAIILSGVARRGNRTVLLSRRLHTHEKAAALGSTQVAAQWSVVANAMAPGLLGQSWPPQQFPLESDLLVVDFDRALLGVGPDWGGQVSTALTNAQVWWMVGGATALVAGVVVAAAVVLAEDTVTRDPDQANFTWEFP